MKIFFANKTIEADVYLVMKDGEVIDVRMCPEDYVPRSEADKYWFMDKDSDLFVDAIIPLTGNIDMGFTFVK